MTAQIIAIYVTRSGLNKLSQMLHKH